MEFYYLDKRKSQPPKGAVGSSCPRAFLGAVKKTRKNRLHRSRPPLARQRRWSRRRRTRSATLDEEAAPGQPKLDLLFPPTGAQIRCPNCGTPYTVPVFNIIDLGVNPELKAPLLSSQINVAACPSCGAGGPLGTLLMVHEPAHQFLGVFVPGQAQAGKAELQQQKAIGDLTQTLMRKLPNEARKGYMLQPKQFHDWQRFMEQLWEFEGVTPEMMRRQRNQSELLQRLVGLADDPKALELVLQRSGELVDRDFFALLDRFMMMAQSQGGGVEPLLRLRSQLLELTAAGKQIKQQQDKVRGILQGLTAKTTREELLDTILDTWRR